MNPRRVPSNATKDEIWSADQEQIEQDRGDAAGDSDSEQDHAADLIDTVHVMTDAMGEIVGGQERLLTSASADNRRGRLSVSAHDARCPCGVHPVEADLRICSIAASRSKPGDSSSSRVKGD